MTVHVHAWVRRSDRDDNSQTLKYRCACGTWGYGTFAPGRGLRIRHHSETTSRRLEAGPLTAQSAIKGHSPNVDPGFEALRERS